MITKGIKELCAEAEAVVETWTVDEARGHLEDEDVVFVDIRDIRELERDGTIPGAFHAPGTGQLDALNTLQNLG